MVAALPAKKKQEQQKIIDYEFGWLPFQFLLFLFLFLQPYVLEILTPVFGKYSELYPYSAQVAEVLGIISLVVGVSFPILAIWFFIQSTKEKSALKYFMLKHFVAYLLITVIFLLVGIAQSFS